MKTNIKQEELDQVENHLREMGLTKLSYPANKIVISLFDPNDKEISTVEFWESYLEDKRLDLLQHAINLLFQKHSSDLKCVFSRIEAPQIKWTKKELTNK